MAQSLTSPSESSGCGAKLVGCDFTEADEAELVAELVGDPNDEGCPLRDEVDVKVTVTLLESGD